MYGASCWLLAALVRWCVLKLSYILHTHTYTHMNAYRCTPMHAHVHLERNHMRTNTQTGGNILRYQISSNSFSSHQTAPPPAFLRLFSPPQILMFAGRFQQTSHPCRRVKGWPLKASPLHTKRCCAPLAFKGSLLQG